MKGLLYKEFYLAKRYYLMSGAMFLITSAMGILIRLSMLYGNLAKREDSLTQLENASAVLLYLPCLVAFISCCTDGGVIFSDYNSHWFSFCGTTVVTEKKTVSVKYTARLISLSTAFVLSLIYTLIISAISGEAFTLKIFSNLFLFLMTATIFSSLYLMFSFRCKSKNAAAVRMAAVAGVIYIAVMMCVVRTMQSLSAQGSGLSEEESDIVLQNVLAEELAAIMKILTPISAVFAVIALTTCFVVSVKALERREN